MNVVVPEPKLIRRDLPPESSSRRSFRGTRTSPHVTSGVRPKSKPLTSTRSQSSLAVSPG